MTVFLIQVLRLAFDNTNNQLFGGNAYREGTYIRIQAPDLSITEWHPVRTN
eukprot:COSAG06_NODE_12767_length_1332_cov_1.765612_3_plen_50_part_01